jgi:D-alanyl-D-alanine carboxypeptidase
LEIKTKILKVLPYWLMFILFATCAEFAGFLMSQNNVLASSSVPQVLGASITAPEPVRGDSSAEIKPINQTNIPDLSDINAKSYLVFDLDTGQTLFEKNSSQKFAIASLTKLMTALVAYKNSDLNGSLSISRSDTLNIKPNLGLAAGDKVKALDVFNSMLIGSCNDAALALANYTTRGSEMNFVDLMNAQAKDLGMQNTGYQNPMGFDNIGNFSTAQDLKILITAEQQLSAFTDLGRRTSYSFTGENSKEYYVTATNKLIKKYTDMQAIKTGFTNEASGAMATKIDLSGHEVVILVLDSQNRESDTLKLKTAVSSSFDWK